MRLAPVSFLQKYIEVKFLEVEIPLSIILPSSSQPLHQKCPQCQNDTLSIKNIITLDLHDTFQTKDSKKFSFHLPTISELCGLYSGPRLHLLHPPPTGMLNSAPETTLALSCQEAGLHITSCHCMDTLDL